MNAITILDIKPFMQLLFQSSVLDSYHFVSGEIQTDMKYTLDGKWNKAFFSEEEQLENHLDQSEYLSWILAKEKIFQLIKGKKTPSILKLVLRLPDDKMKEFIQNNTNFTENDVNGMYVNITFQDQKLNVIFGISYKIFTLDKNLEEDFSSHFITLLKSNSITTEN